MSKADLGTHSEAIICCLGGRGSGCDGEGMGWAIVLGLQGTEHDLLLPQPGTPPGPSLSSGPTRGCCSEHGSMHAYTL